ncbi:MAG: Ribosomal subunit interface protein [Candidatus Saccharibacteria bacterium]|nr:Ribosomal subunit interface protein [Candidatus Saccharibacteria bacterium]
MQINVTGSKQIVDEELRKYVTKQIGRHDKLLGPKTREIAVADVAFKKVNGDVSCKLRVTLPQDTLEVEEITVNAYAATDIVGPVVRDFLTKYSHKYGGGKLYHMLRMRLNRL